jgi:predicted signal transduction protein with EAL and GGDEF domain
LDAVRRPFEVLGSRASVGVSIGVALAPEAGTDRAELMRKADVALYRAKGEGRDRHRIFEPAMDEGLRLRREIVEELRAAAETGAGLEVYYQPQIAGDGERVAGVEALVRWRHPRLGPVPPAQFVPVAEEAGLIGALGERVLRRACAAAAGWPGVSVAVNVSPLQLRSGDFARKVLGLLREAGLDPRRLELEVTEGAVVDGDPTLNGQLGALRKAGVRIAIDDFGTGHSSLSRLRHLAVDKIKIDRSFVQQLGQSASAAAVIRTVVDLGRALGLGVIAEGVETEKQRRALGEAGCREFQGYLFARPLPEREVAERLAPGRDRPRAGARVAGQAVAPLGSVTAGRA